MDASTRGIITSSLLLLLVVCSHAGPTSSWTTCSVTCGGGTQTKTLRSGEVETRACNTQICTWGPWTFAFCIDTTCDGAVTNVVYTRACPAGRTCDGASLEVLTRICPSCQTWGPWTFAMCVDPSCNGAVTNVLYTRTCPADRTCNGASLEILTRICPSCETTAAPSTTNLPDSSTILATLLMDVATTEVNSLDS